MSKKLFLFCGSNQVNVAGGKSRTFSFSDTTNLLDAEIIFINLVAAFSLSHQPQQGYYISNPSPIFQESLNNRKQDFKEYLKRGGILIITEPYPTEFKMIWPKGGAAQPPIIISPFQLFGLEEPIIEKRSGQIVKPASDINLEDIYSLIQDNGFVPYTEILLDNQGVPILFDAGTGNPVGKIFKVENGLILLLPKFPYDPKKFESFTSILKNRKNSLLSYSPLAKPNPPDWVSKILVRNEKTEKEKLISLQKNLAAIQKDIATQEDILTDFDNLKGLIYGNEDFLEKLVEDILDEIGFKFEVPEESNRVDLIIKDKNDPSELAVVEIKGRENKSAGERDGAQLEKWVSEYLSSNGKLPKGILIFNGFAKIPILDRKNPIFPQQMLQFSKPRNHCLLDTVQLLHLILDFRDGEITFEEIKSLLFNTVGILTYKESIEEALEIDTE